MSEALSFDQKVEGLVKYYEALEALDPTREVHDTVANPEIFYGGRGTSVGQELYEARKSVIFDIECHGRSEYYKRDFAKLDLREDSVELRAERADVLAVMTGPIREGEREKRAKTIVELLGAIVNGQEIELTSIDAFGRGYDEPVTAKAQTDRPLFAVFRNGHISARDLSIQYDSPITFARNEEEQVGEEVMRMILPNLFRYTGYTKLPKLKAAPLAA